MSCRACENPEGGHRHSCEHSGTFLAAEAYEGDEVVPPLDLHRFDVHLRFGVAALDEQHARQVMTGLVAAILEEDAVSETEFTLTEREKVGA